MLLHHRFCRGSHSESFYDPCRKQLKKDYDNCLGIIPTVNLNVKSQSQGQYEEEAASEIAASLIGPQGRHLRRNC